MTEEQNRRPRAPLSRPTSPEQRALITALLANHCPKDAHAMLQRTVSGVGVTYDQVRWVRKAMIKNGSAPWRRPGGTDPAYRHRGPHVPRAGRPSLIDPSEMLRRSIASLFERKAIALGCSIEVARIATLYSRAQIVQMAGAAASGML